MTTAADLPRALGMADGFLREVLGLIDLTLPHLIGGALQLLFYNIFPESHRLRCADPGTSI